MTLVFTLVLEEVLLLQQLQHFWVHTWRSYLKTLLLAAPNLPEEQATMEAAAEADEEEVTLDSGKHLAPCCY